MDITVRMTAEEFLEFTEWQKDHTVNSKKLEKMRRWPEVLAKKLGFAVEPDPKKPGKFKIYDQEHMADLWDMAGEILEKEER